jgi:hypothetical protein
MECHQKTKKYISTKRRMIRMVTYVPIGYGVTDENGIAKLDHDMNGNELSHSYTGVGAGEIDVVASLDEDIDESSVQSEPY